MASSISWERYRNFINGEWAPSVGQAWIQRTNPANQSERIGEVPDSTAEDVELAVTAANLALNAWRRLAGAERGNLLYRAADLVEKHKRELARLATREMGKTLMEMTQEVARGADILRYYAGEGMRKTGDVIPSANRDHLLFTTRVPMGVAALITPWNFPVAIPLWKLAPALVYGNTVIWKPSPEASITAVKLTGLLAEAGFPPGVVNLVHGGKKTGEAMVSHPRVQAVSFTGSNAAGRQIAIEAARTGKKVQLEMGGKNPVIVTDKADLDKSVRMTISGAMKSAGQKCTATSRAIVFRSVYDDFKEKLLEEVKQITVGDGLNEAAWMGPLVSQSQWDKVMSYIRQGLSEGAELLCGGKRPEGADYEQGFFIEPTVFANVTTEMTLAQEEIFGPVLALMVVDSLEEALQLANDVRFGLSASIFTEDIQEAMQFIQDMEAGMIRINGESAGVELQAPFGGMKASSSYSKEQGTAAIEFYTTSKTVTICG
ncbi:aldehyde dehydrogenase family protein [Paenibacillus senegalensis]|uniref:aldehyde dehydrogenase family protein n=1 Tax=Paenibacillus senegalensis TaxID=1465766 RepID=UPI00028A3CDF|nr:aldehyde dehydrogenase family protein [Paenibacillus senegalensis]